MNISIVIPAYNEENALISTFIEVDNYLKKNEKFDKYEIILVDDGSTDKTYKIMKNIAVSYPNVAILRFEKNEGVGAVLFAGFKKSKFENIYWLPADNQVPIIEFDKLIDYINDYDIIIARRKNRADNVIRKFFSKFYQMIINLFFGLGVNDINATKLIKRSVIENLNCKVKSGFFDAELLIRAKNRNYKIIEVEVSHQQRCADKQKGASFKTIINIFIDLFYNIYLLKKEFYNEKIESQKSENET